MDGRTQWTTLTKTNKYASALNGFLQSYITEKGDAFTNISNQSIGQNYSIPMQDEAIDKFFEYIAHMDKSVLHFSERQYYSYKDEAGDEHILDHSCLELDFDIYQDTQERITDEAYGQFASELAWDLARLLNLNDIKSYYMAILRKDNIRKDKGKWKESFHARIFLKMAKHVKAYIINFLIEDKVSLRCIKPKDGSVQAENTIDKMSISVPAMLYGSAKFGAEYGHKLYKVYKIIVGRTCTAQLESNIEKFENAREMSLTFDGTLINKDTVELRDEFASSAEPQRAAPIQEKSYEVQIREEADQLAHQDCEADFFRKVLKLLDVKRATNYEDWKSVLLILARKNKGYKVLAIEFSMRCPEKFNAGGQKAVDSLWEWVANEPGGVKKTERTLFFWAREDNPDEFNKLCEMDIYRRLFRMAMSSGGVLNETQISILLRLKYGKLFVTDVDPLANDQSLRNRVWYEFVLERTGNDMDNKSLFKWRNERQYPDQLDTFISDDRHFIRLLNNFISNIDENLLKSTEDKLEKEYYGAVKKNINRLINSLGTPGKITGVLSRCSKEFRCRGFTRMLDKNGDYAGVLNGVLRLQPDIELIQHYHEIPVSRCMDATVHPSGLKSGGTEDMKALEAEIRRLFCKDQDAFEFVMCYLASTLDGNKKDPMFFIWLGEGSNGKSFLLEMHIAMLGHVVDQGYAAKCNINFFTEYNKGSGPDSEKASLKFARFVYTSETEPGVCLLIAKIKELTSETISGNEKYQKQDMFEVYGHFAFCSNNDPQISGGDHGTWRRIRVYNYKLKLCSEPDPGNVFEWKDNDKFVKEYPKSQRWRSAYMGIMLKYYKIFKEKYGMNLNNIPCRTIERETEQYRNEQDTINRFIRERLEKTDDPNDIIKLDDVVQRYQDWFKLKIKNNFDAANIVAQKLLKTDLKKYKKLSGKTNNVSFHSHKFVDPTAEIPLEEDIDDIPLIASNGSDATKNTTVIPPIASNLSSDATKVSTSKKTSDMKSLEENIADDLDDLDEEPATLSLCENPKEEDNILVDDLDEFEIVEMPETISKKIEGMLPALPTLIDDLDE